MKFTEQSITDGRVTVKFTLDDDATFFRSQSNLPGVIIAIFVIDSLTQKITAYYERTYQKKLEVVPYHNFIRKFLREPQYRKQFFTSGEEWDGIINMETESGIHERCIESISVLNSANHYVSFKELSHLKTHGVDMFSRMKKNKLIEIVGKETFEWIEPKLVNEKMQLNALRWVGRGLKKELAVRKVLVDQQISENQWNNREQF